ncbi:anti-sigma F factor antagonist [Alicyclobacillus tolerans]|uniref:anti-sigma F factor antagonist n=1 Tax=Alicyclobacillus tolerans TaxID=90970 RepID=UPI001EFF932B|nr:anti-sigma F factor antagonist [Alicyclobacillus tolerans]MCF8563675.1 anti-sigma F factor antagonist [Alicyclobacillus tolerans]
MALESNTIDGVLVIRLAGDLDHHAAEDIRNEIESQLEQTRYRYLVLSFRGIDFMDSSGLGLILGRYRSVAQRGGKMALCEVNSPLQRLFELSGILKILPVYETEEHAVRALKEA